MDKHGPLTDDLSIWKNMIWYHCVFMKMLVCTSQLANDMFEPYLATIQPLYIYTYCIYDVQTITDIYTIYQNITVIYIIYMFIYSIYIKYNQCINKTVG